MKKKNIQWVPGLRKQPTFGDTTVHWFARGITSEERAQKFHTDDESLPTADLGSASDWLKNPWGVTRHQYGISPVIAQTYSQGKPLVA